DHGEQLGDHGLMEKLGFFEQSYAILGIVRDPRHPESRGKTVSCFTENVDVMPTLCEMMGLDVPLQCDGYSLLPFLRDEAPPTWRSSAHYEWDWRYLVLNSMDLTWPWGRRIQEQNLAVLRGEDFAYVQFGDGSSLDFDLGADPTWKTLNKDPSRELAHAKEMLVWRQTHLERTFTEMLVGAQRLGRWPEGLR
ncbi:MAG: sulfatase/phosphatase domain-containing protein, partial [Actinomycetes bacterium]